MTETVTIVPEYLPSEAQNFDTAAANEIPLATTLRSTIHQVHDTAARSEFTVRFLSGRVDREEYAVFINALYFVYSAIEEMLEECKDHEIVKLIYFPAELNRREALSNDLEYYYGKENLSVVTDPRSMTPIVAKYVQAIRAAGKTDPTLLVAHSYTRYLGDLNGGRQLALKLKKWILGLEQNNSEWESTEGLEFYDFENIRNEKEFINHYREQLNKMKLDDSTKARLLDETLNAFNLNIDLFTEVQIVSRDKKAAKEKREAMSAMISSWTPTLLVTAAAITLAIGFRRFIRS